MSWVQIDDEGIVGCRFATNHRGRRASDSLVRWANDNGWKAPSWAPLNTPDRECKSIVSFAELESDERTLYWLLYWPAMQKRKEYFRPFYALVRVANSLKVYSGDSVRAIDRTHPYIVDDLYVVIAGDTNTWSMIRAGLTDVAKKMSVREFMRARESLHFLFGEKAIMPSAVAYIKKGWEVT